VETVASLKVQQQVGAKRQAQLAKRLEEIDATANSQRAQFQQLFDKFVNEYSA
jgi:hypothetical protein